LYGTYVADGEPHTRLTLAQLNKFDSYPGIRRVYDNGPIKVYDVSALLPPSERAAPSTAPAGGVGTGFQVWVLVLAVFVVARWVIRLSRRNEPFANLAHLVVCGLVVTLVLAVAGAFVIRLIGVPSEVAAAAVLLALAALSFLPQPREAPPSVTLKIRHSRPQVLLGVLGVVLLGVGASVATVASLKDWNPPPQLATVRGIDGQLVAQVQLGSEGPIPSSLVVANRGRVIWDTGLERTTRTQQVELPQSVSAKATSVALFADGRALRRVSN